MVTMKTEFTQSELLADQDISEPQIVAGIRGIRGIRGKGPCVSPAQLTAGR